MTSPRPTASHLALSLGESARTTRRLLCLLVLLFLSVAVACADDVDTLFKQANAKAEARDYSGAMVLYRQALKISPNEPNIVYNAALTAYLGGQYNDAVALWLDFRKLAPNDWHGLSKLIQAYEAAQKYTEADAAIKELEAMRKHDPALQKVTSFVRDQFVRDGHRFLVYQFFEIKPETRGHLWDFVQVGSDGKAERIFYVMYDETTSKIMREQGQKNAEMYFFDEMEPGGRHASFTHLDHKPDYREAVRIMQPIIDGKIKPASSSGPK